MKPFVSVSLFCFISVGIIFSLQRFTKEEEKIFFPVPEVVCADRLRYDKITLPEEEKFRIKLIAKKYEMTPDQELLLMAIRKHEHGRTGKEFGVLRKDVMCYRDKKLSFVIQGEAAAQIILNNYNGDLKKFAHLYAPVGVENDPTNLNQHWYPKIKELLEEWS